MKNSKIDEKESLLSERKKVSKGLIKRFDLFAKAFAIEDHSHY